MDDTLVMVGGRSFQMRAAAAPKARSPTVFSLVRGTTSLLDDDERSRLRVSLSKSLWTYAPAYNNALKHCHDAKIIAGVQPGHQMNE